VRLASPLGFGNRCELFHRAGTTLRRRPFPRRTIAWVFRSMSALTHAQPRRRLRLALIFAGMATLSIIATVSLLVAAVVVH
jgi:hypothetical protein